jgi:hypothetical protein
VEKILGHQQYSNIGQKHLRVFHKYMKDEMTIEFISLLVTSSNVAYGK